MSKIGINYRIRIFKLFLITLFLVESLEAQLPLYRNFTDEDGLPSNTTYQIFEDPKGYLYITTAKGICRFDGAEFVKIKLPNLQSEDMPMAAMDSLGRLWAANLAGELVCVEGLSCKKVILKKEFIGYPIIDIIFNKTLHIILQNSKIGQIYNYKIDINSNFENVDSLKWDNYIIKDFELKYKNGFYLNCKLSNDKLIKLEINLNKILPYKFFPFNVKFINPGDRFHNKKLNYEFIFFIDSNTYIAKYNNVNQVYLVYFNKYLKLISKGFNINSLFEKNDIIYGTTKNNGIIIIYNINNESIGFKNVIKKIEFDKNVYFILDNELHILNIKKNKFEKLNNNEINYFFKGKNKYFNDFKINMFSKGIIKDIYFNSDINVFSNFNFVTLVSKNSSKNILNIRTYALNQRNDTLLMGSTKGLYGYANDTTFAFKGFREFELYITKLYVDSLKTIWICTDGKGLIAYRNSNDIKYFGIEDGLPSLNCSDIVQVDKNRIAVGTDKGLWIYNLKTKNSFLFNKLDGLNSNEITAFANDGEYLWIGTSKGLVKCKIDALKPNPEIPFIEITNARYEYNGIFSNLNSKLNYYQNHLIFNVSSRSLLTGKFRNYFYRLIGLDSNWVHTSDTEIELLGLNPGSYTFEVKVYNEDGIPCLAPATYSFTISPPWWRTNWFYSSIILLIGGGVFWWQKMIKKREAQKYQIQNQINEFRQQALQSQMNPHFIFNSLNAIQSFLTINDEKNAMLYLSKFGRLIRLIFDQSKVKLISIEEEIEMLKNYLELEKLRFKGKVEVRLVIDRDVEANEQDIMVPPLLIQPIIENSFRHGLFHKGEGGILEVLFTIEMNRLKCVVRDNGIGRTKSSEINKWRDRSHKSSGLSTTLDRVKILDNNQGKMKLIINDLVDDAGNPIGTETIIYF